MNLSLPRSPHSSREPAVHNSFFPESPLKTDKSRIAVAKSRHTPSSGVNLVRCLTMDETTPLLPDEALAPVLSNDQADRVPSKDLVEFDPNGDHENPMDWPKAYKWGIVALLAFMAFTVYVDTDSPPL